MPLSFLTGHDFRPLVVMGYVEIIGLVAGLFTSFSQLPQLIKTIKEKEAKSLALGMMLSLMAGLGLWIYYGILRKDTPIVITNCFSELINILLLFFSIKYKKKEA